MQKENKNLEFVQGVNFEFIISLKNNGTKYSLIFEDSGEEICNSKAFVNIATAGRHRGLSTIYFKHNLCHQSKLGRDVELQNTHIVLFKSPRDVMQVTTLGAQLGFGSELVDWYRDATSVPFGHLLIDLSPRTDDRLRYCTNSGSVPSKLYFTEILKHLRTLDDEHTTSLYSPSVPIAFPHMQKPFSSVSPKRVYPVSMQMHSKSTQRKLASHKETSRGKISRRIWVTVAKKNNLEAKKKRFVVRKGNATNSSHYNPPSLILCLDMEQFVLVPTSVYNKSVTTQSVTKQELPKYKVEQPPTYQIDSLKRDINKKLFGKADTLIDKILPCSRIKLSNSQTIILDGVDTGLLISDFTRHFHRKNVDVLDIYIALLDAAGISPSLVFNQNVKAKDRGGWVPFNVLTSEAAETVYARCCYLRFCTQLGKN